MSDLIDRQAAIERFDYIRPRDPMTSDYTHGIDVGIALCKVAIREQPPAQPEIIRCKDCKHWIPYDWMFSEVWQSKNIADYPEDEIGCDCSEMEMKANDFCSRVERRTE